MYKSGEQFFSIPYSEMFNMKIIDGSQSYCEGVGIKFLFPWGKHLALVKWGGRLMFLPFLIDLLLN